MTKAGNRCFLLALVTVAALLAALLQPALPVKANPGWQIQTLDSATDVRVGWVSSIALDSSGNPHISYTYVDITYWNGVLKYASYNGTAWNTETVYTSGNDSPVYSTSLALDSSDRPHISFYESDIAHHDGYYKYASYNGTAWQIQTIESGYPSGGPDTVSSIAVDSSDSPHVSFWKGSDPTALKYASYNGTAWNTEIVDSNCASSNSLAIDGNAPHISYNQDTSGSYLGYATYNGTAWNTTQVTPSWYRGRYNSIAIDSSHYPHISHTYQASGTYIGDLNYAYKDASGWHNQTVDSVGDTGYHTSLALDSFDHPHISYIDDTNNYLKYAWYDGASWNIETVDTQNVYPTSTSLALDSCGYPHISYPHQIGSGMSTICELKYARFIPAPNLTILKGGPSVSKVGDNITYWVAISNTGDVPLQKVSVSDSLVAGIDGLFSATLPVGASENRTYTYTVQAGDEPGPIINTVTAMYGDAYGGACFSNLSVSDNHSVTLVHPSISVSKGGPPISKVGDTITYWAAVTNTGDCTLGKDSISDSLAGNIGSLFAATLDSGVTDNQTYTYVVQIGDPDPLPNTVTVHYHPQGLSNDITDNATYSVNLVHPDILVTKSAAPGTYSAGDNITYTATITNTSTDITLERDNANDSLAGDITALCPPTIAQGASANVTYTYTVKATDPDPLVNLVTVHYHPQGLPNDITDNTTCSVDMAPTITSVTPNQGPQTQTLDIVITGSQLDRVNAVDFGAGITVNSSTVNNSTQVTVNISIDASAAPGTRDVTVTNPTGSDTLADAFTVQQPTQTGSVNTATGTGTVTFTTSNGSITGLAASATTPCGSLGGLSFPQGFFAYSIINIAPGSSVTITMTFPSNMSTGTQYWKCQNGAWVNVTSLLGDNDGDNVLTLTSTDGGLGDTDGVANGTIVDPGGPAIAAAAAAPPKPRASATPPKPLNPPQMSLQYLSVTPQQTSAGQPVTILTNVVNTGNEAGNYNVALKINGQVEQSRMVSVGPQGTQPVKFTIAKAQPGTYTVNIGDQKSSFIVTGTGSRPSAGIGEGLLLVAAMAVIAILVVLLIIVARRRLQGY
jgi:uncharacterized repeat protein (TIGR01451 family)